MLHSLRSALVAPLTAAGLAVLLVSASPAAGDDCVKFSGLQHCALGEASLSTADAGLQVSGVGSDGADGVEVTLESAVDWQAGVQLASGTSSPRMTLGAAAGGEEISTAQVVVEDSELHLSATFTGADGPGTYSILVYNGGTLVGSQGGVTSDRYLNVDEWAELMWEIWDLIGFQYRTASGACVWTAGFSEPLHLVLPNGTKVLGDEIQLVEEVGDGGHFPYVGFDGITMRSSRNLEITSETTH
jgi:hypothetical protein